MKPERLLSSAMWANLPAEVPRSQTTDKKNARISQGVFAVRDSAGYSLGTEAGLEAIFNYLQSKVKYLFVNRDTNKNTNNNLLSNTSLTSINNQG